jgi:hypothetical protein
MLQKNNTLISSRGIFLKDVFSSHHQTLIDADYSRQRIATHGDDRPGIGCPKPLPATDRSPRGIDRGLQRAMAGGHACR